MNLLEAASLASDAPAQDGTWKVRLISEGKGSSGTYTRELLENHHHALDNLLSFKNHPTGWDGPQERDFTMISGEIIGETWVEDDERGLKAVYGNYLPDPEFKDKLERYKNKLGLSIYIEGSGFYRENADGSEEFVVDWLNPEDPYASVDVVIAPGARGKFMENMRKNYDSARKQESKTNTTVVKEKNEGDTMDEEMKALIASLVSKVDSLVADKETAKAQEAQVKADEAAAEARVEAFATAVAAVEEADLLAPQKAEILEAAKKGADVAPLIESAKAIKEAAVKHVTESAQEGAHGRVITESAETKFGAWS